MLPKKFLA